MRRLPVFLALVSALGCHNNAAAGPALRPAGTRTLETPAVVEPIFEAGLKGEWQDHGWADRGPRTNGPERLLLSNYGGWILSNTHLAATYGGLVFRFRASATFGEFLQVRVDSESADIFPRIDVAARHRKDVDGGWSEVFISMSELNPTLAPFNRVVIRARNAIPAPGEVEIDGIGLTNADPELIAKAQAQLDAPASPVSMTVECEAQPLPISPLIYGIAFSALREYESDHQWKVNPAARRWGGNPTSRFNWELGAWNTGSDYFFENVDYVRRKDFTWATFLEVNRDRRVHSALTVPMLGWVAKNTKSVGFPVEEFGPQQQVDGERNAGNGVGKDGKPLRPANPTMTSMVAPPEFIGRWVEAIKKLEAQRGSRVVSQYILDNEPGLWHDTHRDVHPTPLTYDELLDRTIRYGTAIRKVDPEATIAGPAEWGWAGYLYSAKDQVAGFSAKPDRREHGDTPLIEWYLAKLAEHQKKTGVRVLDVLDLHFYPQGKGIGVGTEGKTDADTNALRIRSTRALWDPRYNDESWIKEPVQLIPRMREWSERFYPGLKLSIGEYNFGAERHMSGGLALAEALGRFGQHGLYSAFYWTYPPEGSPAFFAFRAFRDYDGKGSGFLPLSLPTDAPRDTSIFASRSQDGRRVTLVMLNFSPSDGFDASVKLKGCSAIASQRVFSYSGDPRGFIERVSPPGRAYRLAPYSINVIDLTLEPSPK